MRAKNIDLKGDGWTRHKAAIVMALPSDIRRLVRAVGIDDEGCGYWVTLWRESDADARLVLEFLQLVEAELAREEDEARAPTLH